MPRKRQETPRKTTAATGGKRRVPPAARTRRSAQDLLDRIVLAAAEEFKRNGYAGTTTALVARRAEVTEAQLFRYFGSKSNLFRETVFKPIEQHLLHFVETHLPEFDNPAVHREQTHLYTSELQRFIHDNAQLLTSLIVAQTYDAGTAHGVATINSLKTYFDRAAAMMAARTGGGSSADPQLLVRLAFSTVLAAVIFRGWIFPEGLASDAAIETAINDFVLRGVAADKPRR
ncbi:TetR/AcrR family transcriptional regulator [Solimonas terrae]|uniref:TetR/AcrR family transcriptional regulator n=1 Tax=Solimonas terrae TaxID=1396819 RepID=A0A6M2BMZ1_9GAMM|nr:TetR/AcrR family transcriptional regulator [Solimonas terrae]NGY03976.1 TetR/AcrR family transcriptional regulator [Solimonas terrae]